MIAALSFSDGVNGSCTGEAKDTLMEICMSLPEEECISEAPDAEEGRCGADEFSCGDGQCVHGLQTCDNKYDCDKTAADELQW